MLMGLYTRKINNIMERDITLCKNCMDLYNFKTNIKDKVSAKCSFCGVIQKCIALKLTDVDPHSMVIIPEEDEHEYSVFW